ncbi:hypothetical protein IMY05_C2442000500 [Salix suchowensis]|nr:hypothetical protein IMY05_C2442000500 [Salix suchowensis]
MLDLPQKRTRPKRSTKLNRHRNEAGVQTRKLTQKPRLPRPLKPKAAVTKSRHPRKGKHIPLVSDPYTLAKASMKPASKNKKSLYLVVKVVKALLDEVTTRLSAEPPSVKRPVDDSWPLWFKNQYKVLYEVKSMPDVWFVLLAKFDLFEEMTAYNNTGNGLATLKRPEEISWWIRAGQKANPTLSDVDKFGDNWWRWWISLQPEWRGVVSEESALERRHRRADKAVSCAAAAWEELDKPGRNGFLSPIAALFWWASARIDSLKKPVVTEESSEDQALESELTEEHENLPECEDWTLEFEDGHDWLMAVADMTWVMDCMMISRKATT